MAFQYEYPEYYKRGRTARGQVLENQRRTADPVRYQPVVQSGEGQRSGDPVRVVGRNLDGTPESAGSRAGQNRLATIAAGLANQSRRTANQGMAQEVAANRPGEQQRRAGLAQVLSTITPDQANQGYGQLSRVLGTDAPPESLLGRTVEGGGLAGDQRDYFLQTGQAKTQDAARAIFDQERQNLGRGGGVAMTESGKIIRADDNFQYDAQREIENPELRAMVPQLAEANSQAQNPEQKAMMSQVLEFSKAGIDLPEGADLAALKPGDIQKMAVKAGQSQAQQTYNKDYLQMAKIFSNVSLTDEFGQPMSLTPEQIHQQVVSTLGPRPGSESRQPAQAPGADIDQAIQLALGGDQPAAAEAPQAMAQAKPKSGFSLGSVIDGIRGGGTAYAAGGPPPMQTQPQPGPAISMNRTAPIEGAAIDGRRSWYDELFGRDNRRATRVGSVIG